MKEECFLGKPAEAVVCELKKQGFSVEIVKNSKPKIKTDAELVVQIRETKEKQVVLVVGEFLIDVEGKDGLV